MKQKIICILGGSGFVGTQLASRLAAQGHRIRVLTRRRERNRHLLVIPTLDLIQADIYNPSELQDPLQGCDAVINLVGILNERGDDGSGFRRPHVDGVRTLVDACAKTGVPRLLHMSALNADAEAGVSHYLKSKGEGEKIVHQAGRDGMQVSIFRPSVIFGPGDAFFNRFANLLRLSPYWFPLSCPHSRFAPVYVGDVASAFVKALELPEAAGQCYPLCGPHAYPLQALVEYAAACSGVTRRILPLSDKRSSQMADWLERVPGKPFSRDNHRSLQVHSVCQGDDGLAKLGIGATAITAIVPGYLGLRSQRGRLFQFRREVTSR